MTNRLADAISPYLRSHAENPVDWFEWGEDAFAAARARDVPVLVSIGYSTCHWCHVMARESFSDPVLAAELNARFVAIKVDREEHPEVDSAYLTAAGAFTQNLGWPLNVFTTPDAKVFFAGTYSPPVPVDGHASFRQVLDAVSEAWTHRRTDVESTATQLAEAIASATASPTTKSGVERPVVGVEIPDVAGVATGAASSELGAAVGELVAYEDAALGGFGGAPKFPVAPVLRFLLASPVPDARPLALRTLRAMAASPLRDPIEGGFFRYATRRDWSDPHYERMLYDNALLLDAFTTAWTLAPTSAGRWARDAAEGIAGFLTGVMQLPSGGFASAQDSESTLDGVRVEGGYYALDATQRAAQAPPALDEKVLTGWNGLAIAALARSGVVFDRADLIMSAEHAADHLIATHLLPPAPSNQSSPPTTHHAGLAAGAGTRMGRLVRASVGERLSAAPATLEDHGMFADGLLALAAVTGSVRYAEIGRMLVDEVIDAGLRAPGGGDPVLGRRSLAIELDPSEGAYPSGSSAFASAALRLHALTADARYRDAAHRALAPHAEVAVTRPISFGTTLELLTRLAAPSEQMVLIEPDPVDEFDPADEPDPAHEPDRVDEPTAAHEPDPADQPNPADKPDPSGEPNPVDKFAHEPDPAHEPDSVDEPDPADDPGAADEPEPTAAARPEAADATATDADLAMRASGLRAAVRMWPTGTVVRATETQARLLAERGFELFAARTTAAGQPTAYLCRDFVCRLPATEASGLTP